MSKNLKDIGIVSVLTVVSRLLGLARDVLLLFFFGTSTLISAFYAAFTIPNLFRRLLAEGSLSAAFIPTLQEEMHANGRRGVFALLTQVSCWLIVVTGALTIFAIAACSQSRLLPGHAAKWYLTADLTALLFPYLALISLAAAFNATLNVLDRFTEPALSPIWLNLAMIAAVAGAGLHFAHSRVGEIHWLCAGVLAGGFLQMGVPAGVLLALGWRPAWDLALSPRVREVARLMAPGLIGTAIYQVNIAVGRLLAFMISDAGVTELYSANRLMEFPIGVFAIAVSTVVYPLIARHAAAGDRGALAGDLIKGLRMILMINVPAAVGLAILSQPIVVTLYQHGQVHPSAAHEIAVLLAIFSIGLPFFSIVNLTIRAFYAVKDVATPVRIAAVDFLINLAISLSLIHWLGVPGLVVASTTAIIVQTLLFRRALRRRLPEVRIAELWPSVLKIAAAAAGMAALLWVCRHEIALLPLRPRIADLLSLVVLIPAGAGFYGATLLLLRIEGREEFLALLRRRQI
ncbi:MAG: murein biosynthesis integral membrane protein MurJ [Opitutaceae bacterium]